jgi:hypothetical protein
MGTLKLTGPDRTAWLNGLVTVDVQSIGPRAAGWGLALDRKGKIQTVLWVVPTSDALLLATSPGTASSVHEQFDRMLVMEDAELEDVSERTHWSLLLGEPTIPTPSALDVRPFDSLAPGVRAARWEGPTDPVWDAACAAVGDSEWARWRLENDVAEFGVDYTPTDRPHEAGLDRRAVNWNKGCYLGQEVVCMQDMRGKVSRRVTRLTIRAGADAGLTASAEVRALGTSAAVGRLTSVAYSERTGAWLGFAMMPVSALQGPLEVASGADLFQAQPALGSLSSEANA